MATLHHNKITLTDQLENAPETASVQYLKALLREPCTGTFLFKGFKMVVSDTTNRHIEKENLMKKFKWRQYVGEEEVDFQWKEITGCFTHSGPLVTDIKVSFLTHSELNVAVAIIGSYCKWGWETSRKVGKKAVSVWRIHERSTTQHPFS